MLGRDLGTTRGRLSPPRRTPAAPQTRQRPTGVLTHASARLPVAHPKGAPTTARATNNNPALPPRTSGGLPRAPSPGRDAAAPRSRPAPLAGRPPFAFPLCGLPRRGWVALCRRWCDHSCAVVAVGAQSPHGLWLVRVRGVASGCSVSDAPYMAGARGRVADDVGYQGAGCSVCHSPIITRAAPSLTRAARHCPLRQLSSGGGRQSRG